MKILRVKSGLLCVAWQSRCSCLPRRMFVTQEFVQQFALLMLVLLPSAVVTTAAVVSLDTRNMSTTILC